MGKYVIDKDYCFDLIADGARPSSAGSNSIHLQFEHGDVMEMGEYFYQENPYEIDFDYNFGIKDKLDEILLEDMIEEVKEEWEEEYADDPDKGEPDFYDLALYRIADTYHCWDEEFKQDCIDYYLSHKDSE